MSAGAVGYPGPGSPLDVPAALVAIAVFILFVLYGAWVYIGLRQAERGRQQEQRLGRLRPHDPLEMSRVGKAPRR